MAIFATFLIFLIVIALFAIQARTIKNLRKSNKEQAIKIRSLNQRAERDLVELTNYLTQDPIAAYHLLQTHVENAEKRQK